MKVLHIVPGLNEPNNGIAVAAKLIAEGQLKSGAEVEVVDTRDFVQSDNRTIRTIEQFSEVWVHSMWLPQTMLACWNVIRAGKRLVRMTHANLDPVRLGYHGCKKRLVAPIERWLFRHTDRVVVTCEAEKRWCEEWGLKNRFEIVNLKRFFDLNGVEGPGQRSRSTAGGSLRVLYLGRRHPLKGVEFLGKAVEEIRRKEKEDGRKCGVELQIVSNAFGEAKEKAWEWCDVLVLPTLSENFGLVVAEALERGKRVITTDGAPVWEGQPDVIYLNGYRDGTDEARVGLLKNAIATLLIPANEDFNHNRLPQRREDHCGCDGKRFDTEARRD